MTPQEYVNSANTTEERNFRKIQVFSMIYGTPPFVLPRDSVTKVPEKKAHETMMDLLDKLTNQKP